jgi:hypothetical protein
MATLYISEYADLPFFAGTIGAVTKEPALAEQVVNIGGGNTQSQPFSGSTKIIRVHVDSTCSIAIGTNPVATTSVKRLAANQTEYFSVLPGNLLGVITNT